MSSSAKSRRSGSITPRRKSKGWQRPDDDQDVRSVDHDDPDDGSDGRLPLRSSRPLPRRTYDEFDSELDGAPDKDPDEQLDALRDQLSTTCARIARKLRATVKLAIAAGHLLQDVKRLVGHGRFQTWVNDNLEISDRSARAYMRLAAHESEVYRLLAEAKRQRAADLTIADALKGLPKPGETASNGSTTKKTRKTAKARGREDRRRSSEAQRRRRAAASDDVLDEQHDGVDALDDDAAHTPSDVARRGRGATVDVEFEVVDDQLPAAPEDAPDDAEWLRSLPVRGKLANPAVLDREALLWRRLQSCLDRLRSLYSPTQAELKECLIHTRAGKSFPLLVARLVGVLPPHDWRLCTECGGKGHGKLSKFPCTACEGHGYVMPHAGQAAYDPESVAESD